MITDVMDEQIITDVIAPPGGGVSPGRTGASQEGVHIVSEDIDFDGIEQGGATAADTAGVATSTVEGTSELLDDSSEVAGETLGDVADSLGEAAVGDLLTSDTEVPDAPASKPETALEHDLAEDVAYAEKPRLDDIETAEAAGKLTPENKELLEWLASEAAEKAVTEYVEGKNKMSEAEAAIREKAEEMKSLNVQETRVIGDGDKADTVENAQLTVNQLVDQQLERILNDSELSAKERLKKVGDLKHIANSTEEVLQDIHKLNSLEEIERTWSSSGDEVVTARLWGLAVGAVAGGYLYQGVSALSRIAEKTSQDPTDLIDSILPSVNRGRRGHNTRASSSTDTMMDGYGYIWSPTKSAYVKYVTDAA